MISCFQTDPGKVRSHNEDSVNIIKNESDEYLCVVADGMGGHKAADIASASIIFGATLIHLPVSTTHVISSSIMGVGAAQNVKGVNWGTARKMVTTWIITIPISAVMAAVIFTIINIFF